MTLAANDVVVRYPGAVGAALAGASIAIAPGEMVALAGENGCGKSTLCHVLAGALAPDGGTITLDGTALEGPAPARTQLLQQAVEDQVVAPVVRDDVAFGAECLGLPPAEVNTRVREALAAVGLAGFERREVTTLSGGELARLALAGALAVRPAYLIGDEPTAQLDPASADRFIALLRARAQAGAGVLLVTHRIEEARHADRLVLMRAGRIVAEGVPRTLLYDEEALRACGLETPPVVRLVRAWQGAGRMIEGSPLDAVELAEAACLASI
jgi:energy-coupling factor transporter ATP-binding protein EcfA2